MNNFFNFVAPNRLEDFKSKEYALLGSNSSQENYESFIQIMKKIA